MPDPQAAVAELRDRMLPHADQIAEAQVGRLRARASDLGVDAGDDALWRALRDGLAANIPLFFAGLLGGGRPPAAFSPQTARMARVAAARGVPVERLVLVLRAGQSQAWEVWRALVAGLDLDAEGRGELLDLLLTYNFAWFDALGAAVVRAYGEQPLVTAVQRVLAGEEEPLGYDLTLVHVGLVAWGDDPARAADAARAIPHAALLAVEPHPDAAWLWLGATRWEAPALRALARLDSPPGVRVAVGEPRAGVDGFRATHALALDARRGAPPGRAVTAYRDVALEALALRDEAAARAFVTAELGPLGGGERGERARATLRALFSAGSASGAAGLLGISDRAVAYRVRAVEEALGGSIHARRTELDAALRLERALGAEP